MNNRQSIQASVVTYFLIFLIPAVVSAQEVGEFDTYKEHQHQFLVDLPAGWSAYEQMKAITGKATPTGMIIFSKENIAKMDFNDQLKAMKKWDAGEMPSFFVDRLPKKKKMSCNHFGKNEIKLVTKLIKKDIMFGRDRKVIMSLSAKPIPFGGCEGVRLKGETEKQDGTRWVMDVHAVSDGKLLYMFALRNIKENYVNNINTYEKAMSTVQLTSIE